MIEFEFEKIQDHVRINWKVFWMTLIATFLVVSLHYVGVKFSLFTSPLIPIQKETNVLKSLKSKIEQHPNSYKVQKKETSFFAQVHAESSIDAASAYGVLDFETGDVIASKNFSQKMPIASLTKIMSAVIALDLMDPQSRITISQKASTVEPTTIGVVPNQKMTVKELLQALLLTSANDAAQALNDGVNSFYKSEVFIPAMNEKATFLGLSNTHFNNPQGFDGRTHYSSIEDLAILTHYALTQYSLIAEIVKRDYIFLEPSLYHKQFDLYNWNGLLGVYPNIEGVKIGNTDAAGKTTIVVASRNGEKMMAIILGAPGIIERDLWASQLLDVGFQRKYDLTPIKITEAQLREKYSTWKYWN